MYQAKYAYGCKPSRHHVGDMHYACAGLAPTQPVLSWRAQCSAPFNQLQTSSCTGNASAKALQLRRTLEGKPAMVSNPSRDFLYYNGRAREGTTGQDGGATIRDVGIGATEQGFCDETLWEFTDANLLVKPNQAAYQAAVKEEGAQFMWVPQSGGALLIALKTALAAKDPIFFGITVYESFESAQTAKTGRVPMPQSWEQILGGHAVCMIGWNDHIKCFECANSWGSGWGDHGYFWLPYSFVEDQNLASDFGAIKVVA
jgi:C1A family cysteine protease